MTTKACALPLRGDIGSNEEERPQSLCDSSGSSSGHGFSRAVSAGKAMRLQPLRAIVPVHTLTLRPRNFQIARPWIQYAKSKRAKAGGFTLIELILAVAILLILATTALPLTRVMVKREKEAQLRYALVHIRKAIDRYKDAADKNQIQVKAGTEGYPPDLDTLVKGVQLTGASDKKVHFLSRIPKDPMTGNTEWGMRSVQDDTDTTSWGGQDVFDVYSKSTGTALDGTKYSDW
jgi:general secretion pathway protein G